MRSECKHLEYYDRLRVEALEYRDVSVGSMNQEMPYMDSFIKETARTTPAIILSAPGRVMVPYTSAQSWHSPAGNTKNFGHVTPHSKGFASSTRTAPPSLASLIRVTTFHSGDRFAMPVQRDFTSPW
ncbi:4aead6a5-581b-4f01-a8ba-aa5a1291a5b1 [Sclerotinia trifoliorum]|uniref:4aead6a5-581b-4f01-a8ba-aa5a1291a5b1 n=1 Tax=Sclerotinia trifoliorum TaxID=28548 RepID=A0A8H2VV67_9HELO|nr:4aead6a5-581b-4f01-a8ba-aa5a1291a5b1 [Sclerotinia trifoliorum]